MRNEKDSGQKVVFQKEGKEIGISTGEFLKWYMDNTNIRVEFRIMGEDYNVEEITDVLKIKPTNSWNKGEIIKNTIISRNPEWLYPAQLAVNIETWIISKINKNKHEKKT